MLLVALAFAGTKELQNDNCACDGSEENISFQQGFADGECWAVTYVPDPADYPFDLYYLTMMVGRSGDGIFDIGVYNVDADNVPTTMIDTEAAQISGSEDALAQVYFADMEVDLPTVESGNIAVSVCLDGHSGEPAIARDTDGLDYEDRNYIWTGGDFYPSRQFGLTGDWIMRLGIKTDNVEADTDTDSDSDSDADSDTDTDTDVGTIELYAVSPASAKEGEAINIVIQGEGFATGADARIGGISVTGATVQDAGTISGRTPNTLAAGVYDVEVVNLDGTRAYLAAAFTVEGACGCATGGTGAWWLGGVALALVFRRQRA